MRILVVAFGVISGIAGSFGTFKHVNTAGFTTLIFASSFALLIARIGRWPNRLGFGKGEVDFPQVSSTTLKGLVKAASYKDLEDLNNAAAPKDAEALKRVRYEVMQSI